MKVSIFFFFSFFFFIMHNLNYRVYTNALYIKQLFYYWICSFSGSDLHVSYDWWTTNPRHASQPLSDMPFCAYSKHNSKPKGACKSTLHQTTPPLPSMLLFCWKQQSSYNLQATDLYIHCCLIILCTSTHDNKTQGTYMYEYTTNQATTLLPRMHIFRSTKWAMTYELHPGHPSIFCSEVANTV